MIGLSLDIETLSSKPNAAVVEVAGIWFTIEEDKIKLLRHVLMPINPLTYAKETRFDINIDTIHWWLFKSGRDIKDLFIPGVWPLSAAISDIRTEFLGKTRFDQVYTRGNFDVPILSNLVPDLFSHIQYNNFHDVRTLHQIPRVAKALPKIKNGLAHHALADALHNIQVVALAYDLPLEFSPECQHLKSFLTTSNLPATQSQLELPIDGQQ